MEYIECVSAQEDTHMRGTSELLQRLTIQFHRHAYLALGHRLHKYDHLLCSLEMQEAIQSNCFMKCFN